MQDYKFELKDKSYLICLKNYIRTSMLHVTMCDGFCLYFLFKLFPFDPTGLSMWVPWV